jgi:acyl-[acyl carrier protein]--UDP-N-acetylglucosamine O-acyltransferase
LRRAGVSGEQRTELKRLYHALFREGENIATSLASAQKNFPGEYAQILLQFITSSQRGVCRATVSSRRSSEDE